MPLFCRKCIAFAIQTMRQSDEINRAVHRFFLGIAAVKLCVICNCLHVLQQCQIFGNLIGLKCSTQTEVSALVSRYARNQFAIHLDPAAPRFDEA